MKQAFGYPIALAALLLADVAGAADEHPGRYLAANCTGCHGTQGRSEGGMPTLAGLDRSYLLNAMSEFRNGARAATIMHQHAKGYTEAQIELMADYFASQRSR
jgi:cytochrome c553